MIFSNKHLLLLTLSFSSSFVSDTSSSSIEMASLIEKTEDSYAKPISNVTPIPKEVISSEKTAADCEKNIKRINDQIAEYKKRNELTTESLMVELENEKEQLNKIEEKLKLIPFYRKALNYVLKNKVIFGGAALGTITLSVIILYLFKKDKDLQENNN